MRRTTITAVAQAAGSSADTEVEVRKLSRYDALFGIDGIDGVA